MITSILQDFLDNRFIKTDDADNLKSLKVAASEVEKQLRKKKNKLISYTLVAFDPTVASNDPVVEQVEQIIIKKQKQPHTNK